MASRRHTPEEIVIKLRQVEVLVSISSIGFNSSKHRRVNCIASASSFVLCQNDRADREPICPNGAPDLPNVLFHLFSLLVPDR